MNERDEALAELGEAGVLAGLRWAWGSALGQTLHSFDPSTGHDQGWVGYNAFKVFGDRLDRVFSCGRFVVRPDADPAEGVHIVQEGLTEDEFRRMPRLAAGLVHRDDLTGSPGWRLGGWRILLQSFGGKNVDHIPWPQKSPTKQWVATQPPPGQLLLPMDGLMASDVLAEVPDEPAGTLGVVTLVAAYAIDVVTEESTLQLGRPRYNLRGSHAWHWRVDLGPAPDGQRAATGAPAAPPAPPGGPVGEPPVRLRPAAAGEADAEGAR